MRYDSCRCRICTRSDRPQTPEFVKNPNEYVNRALPRERSGVVNVVALTIAKGLLKEHFRQQRTRVQMSVMTRLARVLVWSLR